MIDAGTTVVLVLQMVYIGYVDIHRSIQLHVLVAIELLHMVMESMWHLLLRMVRVVVQMFVYHAFDASAGLEEDTSVLWNEWFACKC